MRKTAEKGKVPARVFLVELQQVKGGEGGGGIVDDGGQVRTSPPPPQ